MRNNKQPVQTFFVTEYLDSKLCEVYENERIFDKFDLHVSPCSTMCLTGSYFSQAHVIDMQKRINTTLNVKFMDRRGKHAGQARYYKGKRVQGSIKVEVPQNVPFAPPRTLNSASKNALKMSHASMGSDFSDSPKQ